MFAYSDASEVLTLRSSVSFGDVSGAKGMVLRGMRRRMSRSRR